MSTQQLLESIEQEPIQPNETSEILLNDASKCASIDSTNDSSGAKCSASDYLPSVDTKEIEKTFHDAFQQNYKLLF